MVPRGRTDESRRREGQDDDKRRQGRNPCDRAVLGPLGCCVCDNDDQLGFLSVSMARTLRGILADGRVSKLEREHFLDALDRDSLLTREQKTKVRATIEEWFTRDVGRAEALT